jgi:hypothetical protein
VAAVINDDWHRTHRLGPHAPLDERIEWHIAHEKHCACRSMPARIRHEIARRRLVADPAVARGDR